MSGGPPRCIGLVVHPTREIERAIEVLRAWTAEHGTSLVQLATAGTPPRHVAPTGEAGACDLVAAVGGDGTVLSAVRMALEHGAPVLGVACGSLGALTAVAGSDLADALDEFAAGRSRARKLPVLTVTAEDGTRIEALNDLVIMRDGSGQLSLDVAVDGEPYARMSGDGAVVATALGSTAYTLSAGGPLLAPSTPAYVCTPLAMHGRGAPALVVPAGAHLELTAHRGFVGFRLEVDGQRREPGGDRFTVALREDAATLVAFGAPDHGLAGLRRRHLIVDSPRVLARDAREGRAGSTRQDG